MAKIARWAKFIGATFFYLIYTIPTMAFVTKEGSLINIILGTFRQNCSGHGDFAGSYCLAFGTFFAGLQLLLLLGEIFATLWYIKQFKSHFEISLKIKQKQVENKQI